MATISNIISMNQCRYWKNIKKEDEAERKMDKLRAAYQEALEEDRVNHSEETAVALFAAGGRYMEAIMRTGFGEMLDEAWKRREEIFRERYQKVFENAPDMPVARIKYFCAVLLKLIPVIASENRKERCFAYDDFFNLYMEGIDVALSRWCSYDREAKELAEEVELEHPFLQTQFTEENTEPLLVEILEEIIEATPEKDTAAKRDFLWGLTKLFLFCRELAFASDIGGR